MGRQKHTAEQIINKLREAEVLQAKGMSLEEMMKQLEQENSQLRKMVSDLSIDNAILKEVARGNI